MAAVRDADVHTAITVMIGAFQRPDIPCIPEHVKSPDWHHDFTGSHGCIAQMYRDVTVRLPAATLDPAPFDRDLMALKRSLVLCLTTQSRCKPV